MYKERIMVYDKKSSIILLFLIFSLSIYAQNGLVIAPVADLVGQPLGSLQAYQSLPWAMRGSDYAACPRVHQLLFHETVEILEKNGDEMKVRIPNLFYQTAQNNTPQTDYWMLASNVRSFDTISPKEQRNLPIPIRFNRSKKGKQPIVTLIAPYYDPKIQMTLSAGTRFVRATRTTKARVSVYRFNPNRLIFETIALPSKLVYQQKRITLHQQRADFIHLLQSWAHTPGAIPYVWGGCSFTKAHAKNQFHTGNRYYTRKGDTKRNPKTGFDCTGIVARAAQIVGLPYFLKNSYTIAHNLPLLRANENLQPGDIIWLPGHVIVVSDIKNNLVVEAHAYGSGYGKVHELPINRIFKGIETLQDLELAFRNQTTLHRLDSKGKVFAQYPQFKLLQISSIV